MRVGESRREKEDAPYCLNSRSLALISHFLPHTSQPALLASHLTAFVDFPRHYPFSGFPCHPLSLHLSGRNPRGCAVRCLLHQRDCHKHQDYERQNPHYGARRVNATHIADQVSHPKAKPDMGEQY